MNCKRCLWNVAEWSNRKFHFGIGLGKKRKCVVHEHPLISIIVASYNYAHFISETISSLLDQTYTNFEIIVVDDGSQDESLEVIGRFVAMDNRVHLFMHSDNANHGLPQTLMLGLSHAMGEYVAFCESDDLWLPDHLKEKVLMINKYNDVAIISNDIELFGDEEQMQRQYIPYLNLIKRRVHPNGCFVNLKRRPRVNVIPTFSCVMVRRDVLMTLDFNSPIAAWTDFWLWRQVLARHLLFYVDKPLTRWRVHQKSYNDTTNKYFDKYMAEFLSQSNQLVEQQRNSWL